MSSKIRITSDEGEESKRKELEEIKRLERLDDLKKILSTPEGVRFFKRFFDEGQMFSTSMTGNSWTFFKEGQRNFVLSFFKDICHAAPEKIPELIVREGKDVETFPDRTDL